MSTSSKTGKHKILDSKYLTIALVLLFIGSIVFAGVDVDKAFGFSSDSQGQGQNSAPAAPEEFSYKVDDARASQAQSELAALRVAPKGTMDGYTGNREELFGDWSSGERGATVHGAGNGCDTRNDILARDLTDVKLDSDGCTVLSGRLWNPYGTDSEKYNHYIDFERGRGTSMAVQIDHVIALGNVWVSGGDRLTEQQRLDVANDPINLIAVDGPTNGSKGDRDASEWMPPNDRIHCFYAASQIQVKYRYDLSVTQAEKQALEQALTTCPSGI